MEVDQFISPGMKSSKLRRRKRVGSSHQECSQEGHQETNEAEDNILLKNLSNYFRYFSVFFSVSSDNTRFSFMLGTRSARKDGEKEFTA